MKVIISSKVASVLGMEDVEGSKNNHLRKIGKLSKKGGKSKFSKRGHGKGKGSKPKFHTKVGKLALSEFKNRNKSKRNQSFSEQEALDSIVDFLDTTGYGEEYSSSDLARFEEYILARAFKATLSLL